MQQCSCSSRARRPVVLEVESKSYSRMYRLAVMLSERTWFSFSGAGAAFKVVELRKPNGLNPGPACFGAGAAPLGAFRPATVLAATEDGSFAIRPSKVKVRIPSFSMNPENCRPNHGEASVLINLSFIESTICTWSTFDPGAAPYILSRVNPSSHPILRAKRLLS